MLSEVVLGIESDGVPLLDGSKILAGLHVGDMLRRVSTDRHSGHTFALSEARTTVGSTRITGQLVVVPDLESGTTIVQMPTSSENVSVNAGYPRNGSFTEDLGLGLAGHGEVGCTGRVDETRAGRSDGKEELVNWSEFWMVGTVQVFKGHGEPDVFLLRIHVHKFDGVDKGVLLVKRISGLDIDSLSEEDIWCALISVHEKRLSLTSTAHDICNLGSPALIRTTWWSQETVSVLAVLPSAYSKPDSMPMSRQSPSQGFLTAMPKASVIPLTPIMTDSAFFS